MKVEDENTFAEEYMETVRNAVRMRIDRGDHPHDAMCMAKEMLDAYVATHIDGSYPAKDS